MNVVGYKFLILALAFLVGCSAPQTEQTVTPEQQNIGTLEEVNESPESPDWNEIITEIPPHTFQKGETLWDLARENYGNRHYSALVLQYNDIQDASAIEPGTPIFMPPLEYMLLDEKVGLAAVSDQAIKDLVKAITTFQVHEDTLLSIRDGLTSKDKVPIPEQTFIELEEAEMALKSALLHLSSLENDSIKPPTYTLRQIRSTGRRIKKLREGFHDGDYGYDVDLVHQDWIRGTNHLMYWAKNNYQQP